MQKQHRHDWIPLDCALLDLDMEEWVVIRFVCTCEECNAVKVVVEKLQDVGKEMEK